MARLVVSGMLACALIACDFDTSPIVSGARGARSDDSVSHGGTGGLDTSALHAGSGVFDGTAGRGASPSDGPLGGTTRVDGGGAPQPDASLPPGECREHPDCIDPQAPLCELQARRCVECLSHADCGDLARPQCQAHECVPCTSSHACAGRIGATVCDNTGSIGGSCVECTATDEAPCGGNACDPQSRSCTGRPLAGTGACQPCVADSECVTDHRCIAMEYAGVALPGGACLKRAAAGCERPYTAAPIRRPSRSGAAPEDYCGIDEVRVTCAAIAALTSGAECPNGDDAECNAQGAICENVSGVEDRCTYACSESARCPLGLECDDHCGGDESSGGRGDDEGTGDRGPG